MQLLEFPELSTAVDTTVLVPNGNAEPDGGTLVVTSGPSQLSTAVDTKLTTAVALPGSLVTTMVAGQLITGGCVSKTMTRNEQLLALPALSVA